MKKENVVLITGCSTGIGRGLAEVLAERGFQVVATARDVSSIGDLQATLKLPLDVTDEASVKTAAGKVLERFGRIDVLVNNAGYATRGVIEEMPIETMRREFDVNVFGIVRMVQTVAPIMRAQKSGKIINIGSISGQFSQPVNGAYCASKFAVEALTESLRYELGGWNIQVAVIEPGPIDTNFVKTSTENSDDITGNPESPYAGLYASDREFRRKQNWSDRGKAVEKITSIVSASKLKIRYKVAVPYGSKLVARVPDGVREYMMKSVYRN
jgi:NAD(P)-dependent dehydrogenase (short-subunit alcohol dehydrogenase family)